MGMPPVVRAVGDTCDGRGLNNQLGGTSRAPRYTASLLGNTSTLVRSLLESAVLFIPFRELTPVTACISTRQQSTDRQHEHPCGRLADPEPHGETR